MEVTPTNFEELWEVSELARKPKYMTFGKYKGKLVSEIDRGYRTWLPKQDIDPYLRIALGDC